jgi:hypothetical protein
MVGVGGWFINRNPPNPLTKPIINLASKLNWRMVKVISTKKQLTQLAAHTTTKTTNSNYQIKKPIKKPPQTSPYATHSKDELTQNPSTNQQLLRSMNPSCAVS